MGFIAFGLFIFIAVYLFTPVIGWTQNMYDTLNEKIGDSQLAMYRSIPDNPYRGLAMGIGSIMAGFLLALATVILSGWAAITYLDDGFVKAILLFSLFIGLIIMPVIFAVQLRISVDNWFKFRHEKAL